LKPKPRQRLDRPTPAPAARCRTPLLPWDVSSGALGFSQIREKLHVTTSPSRRDVAAGALLASLAAAPGAGARSARCCPIVELRQYTCRGGRRDELIALFEREFVESQEALGARVIGTFRDLDDPDRFVWLRGFESMPGREQALSAFYGGPVWQAHRNAANATIADSDNVLLLHPARPGGGFDLGPAPRRGGVIAGIHYLSDALLGPFAELFDSRIAPRVTADGGEVLATFVSETAPNTFPRLPVRENERIFVWFARARDGDDARLLARRASWRGWRDEVPEALLPALFRKPEILRLQPTPRSRLR
jgi:hypothetical protein